LQLVSEVDCLKKFFYNQSVCFYLARFLSADQLLNLKKPRNNYFEWNMWCWTKFPATTLSLYAMTVQSGFSHVGKNPKNKDRKCPDSWERMLKTIFNIFILKMSTII